MTNPKQASVTFYMDGKQYGFNIYAESWEDAERRLRAIRATATVTGWPCYSYRVNSLTLPFVAAWVAANVFIRNLFRVKP